MSYQALLLSNTPEFSVRVTQGIPNFPLTVESKLIDHPKGKTIDLYCRQGLARFVNGEYRLGRARGLHAGLCARREDGGGTAT